MVEWDPPFGGLPQPTLGKGGHFGFPEYAEWVPSRGCNGNGLRAYIAEYSHNNAT
jgi:hypothetical protein